MRGESSIFLVCLPPGKSGLFYRAAGFVMMISFPLLSYGQQDWEKDGGIPSAEIEIIKDRQITLPPADRNFDKIPPRPMEPVKPEIVYEFRNLRFNTPDFNPVLRPLKLKQEDISRIYGNFVSAGYGNYASPYLEAYFNSRRDKNKFYGAHFYHQSSANGPVDSNNSASGSTEINFFGKSITNSVVVSGNLNYENRTIYFYGYPAGSSPKRDRIRQSYNVVGVGAGIENSKLSDFSYALQGSYSYLMDHYRATESEFGLAMKSAYQFSAKAKFILKSDYFFIDRKDSIAGLKPRNLFSIKPAYQFTPLNRLWLTLGANVAIQNDTIGKQKSFHMYPNLKADYSLSESVIAYVGLTGDIDKVSLHTLSRENPWVNSNINIAHTNRAAEFISGIKGNVDGKVAFGAGVSLSTLKNLYFFKNDSLDRAKFDVTYDVGNTQRDNIFAELGYNHGETLKMVLRGDYFHYSTDKQLIAFHRPAYRVTFNSSYSLYSKLLFNIDFVAQGGMKAFDFETLKTVALNPAMDLNARVDYFFSKSVSAFLKFNNLLSSDYQLYLHYPVRGFQMMGGVSWSF